MAKEEEKRTNKKAAEDLNVDEKEQKHASKKAAEDLNAESNEQTDNQSDLEQQIADLQTKYDEMEDKYLRAEAEMQNMTKRFKNEQAQLLKYEGQKLATEILPVMDNLNRALQIEVEDEASAQLKHGIEMEALNQPFDPTKHQAVKSVPVEKGQKAETVVEVYQDGYMLKDRVLRPAMVVVAQ